MIIQIMERFNLQAAWMSLKPCCDKLIQEPNIENTKNVLQGVESISNAIVQDLIQYILFPVTVHLQNNCLSKDVKLHMVNLTKIVIGKCRINDLKLFMNIYAVLRSQIAADSSTTEVISGHEELKESVMTCITTLIQRSTTDVIEQYYVRTYAVKLAHGVYLCILLARTEKSRSVRLTAIEAAMHLLQIHDEADKTDTVLRSQVSDVIMIFLPGVASGLQEISLGSETQSHLVTVLAIRAWGRLMALVMEDVIEPEVMSLDILCKKMENNCSDPLGYSIRQEGEVAVERLLRDAKRTPEWFNAVAIKLNVLMKEWKTITKHSHYKVRLELTESIRLLLFLCTRNMKPCFSNLLEILITLSEDNSEKVANAAKHTLNSLSEKCNQDKSMKSVVELSEENFYNLLTKLPRIIRTSDNSTQLSYLNELAGYLRFLGKQRLPRIMTSNAHLHRLLLALVYMVELDCNNISILEDVSMKNVHDTVYNSVLHSWKQFKFIFDASIEEKLISICKLLTEMGDFEILVDSILRLMFDAPQHKKEFTLLLNWLLDVSVIDPTMIPLYKQVVDQYISSDFWYLPTALSEDTTLREARNNVVQCCLLVEGLGIISKALNSYEHFLLKTLYLVIEKAGSGHSLLRLVGLQSLENIAKAQRHETVAELFRANVDYLAYHVTIKLRRVERNPGVLDVVGIIVEYSTIDFLPCLKDIVDDVLRQINASSQKNNVHAFLKVFYTFAICVRKMISNEKSTLNFTEKPVEPAQIVIKYVLAYIEAKKASQNFEDEVECTSSFSENEIKEGMNKCSSDNEFFKEKESEVKPPFFVKMIKDVMKNCLHFLPSKELEISLLSMSMLNEGLLILANWENTLLPIVHQIWHPLVERFRNENPLVINRAWQLLVTLAKVSKDFIRSRTLKGVLPSISEFFEKASKESYKKDSGSVYRFTQIYKLQHELLSQLGKMAKDLMLFEAELWKILDITEPYLSSLQNPMLQQCCVTLYKDVVDCNADIVWVKCLSIWNDHIEPVPCDDFDSWYTKVQETDIQSEYLKNIKTILSYIQDKEKIVYKV